MAKAPKDYDDDDIPDPGRGRSANRREALGYDAFALKLIELSADRCKRLPVSEELRASLKNVQDTRSKAARRRHLRHLSGMLRNRPNEAAAIEAYLDGRAFTPITGDEENRDLEALREALATEEQSSQALDSATESLPQLDVLLVRDLCSSLHSMDTAVRRESKAYRLLFKELRRASDELEAED
ncbi:MAG: DUF615 domain-containing protein [Myxococcales bacterium]|nr:DUF615 domain-containing protein [Myxococcales bacterium]